MRGRCAAGVTGPLAEYADGFRADLGAQGYVRDAVTRQMGLMSDLSDWLAVTNVGVGELVVAARVDEFLGARQAEGYRILLSRRALMPLVDYLSRRGAVTIVAPVIDSPSEALVEDYRRYLMNERGLADRTVGCYLGAARLFLSESGQPEGFDLDQLTAGQVSGFVVDHCRCRSHASAMVLVTGLRSLLRFLFLSGYTSGELAGAVPTPSGFGGGSLPRPLALEAVAALLDSCRQESVIGRRDLAILTVLARLGLRAAEVAGMELDDLDWHHGEITVRGKGKRRDRLPLPDDVGQALVAYLRDARPRVRCRVLFLRTHAPITGLTAGGIGDVVRSACKRAGIAPAGPHRLRHHAASAMLQGGASLEEVGQVLRQVRASTTAIYAKVDRVALQALAQPWPGGAA